MNKITALFVALLYTFISTSAFSYGGPTVNDRNVQPLYGPKLAKKKIYQSALRYQYRKINFGNDYY